MFVCTECMCIRLSYLVHCKLQTRKAAKISGTSSRTVMILARGTKRLGLVGEAIFNQQSKATSSTVRNAKGALLLVFKYSAPQARP